MTSSKKKLYHQQQQQHQRQIKNFKITFHRGGWVVVVGWWGSVQRKEQDDTNGFVATSLRRECCWGALTFADHFDQYSNSDSFKVHFLRGTGVICNKS